MASSYFDYAGREIIPSIRWTSSPRLDTNSRDQVALTSSCVTLRDRKMHTEFNRASGELRFTVYDGLIHKDDFNRCLAHARESFGKDNVKQNVVFVLNDDGVGEEETTLAVARLGVNLSCGDRKAELIRRLIWHGYVRDVSRETAMFMCFRSPARQWKF
jgi:hypothetical protein